MRCTTPTVLCWMTRTARPITTSTRTTSAIRAINSGMWLLRLRSGVLAARRRRDDQGGDALDLDDLDAAARGDRLLVVETARRPHLAADLDLAGLELGDGAGDDADLALHGVDAGAECLRLADGALERGPGERQRADRERGERDELERDA